MMATETVLVVTDCVVNQYKWHSHERKRVLSKRWAIDFLAIPSKGIQKWWFLSIFICYNQPKKWMVYRMNHNDRLTRLRYALDIKDTDMVKIFELGGASLQKKK